MLAPDTDDGAENSPQGRLVRAYLAGPIPRSHLPALLGEARHCLQIINDLGDWEDYPDQASDRRELQQFIHKHSR